MRSRFVVLLSLFLAAVAPAVLAQETVPTALSGGVPAGIFYYHWETPERLLLWQDLDQLVGVTVELRNGKWLPADRQGLLKRLSEEIKKQHPKEEDRAIVQKQWEGSLDAALRRSGGDYKRWLETVRLPNGPTPGFIPRQPDVMIYLHVDTAEKKAHMRLLSGLAAVGSQAYEILQKKEGQQTVWATSGNIPIETALGVKWRSALILEIAGLEGRPWPADFWSALIDAWKAKPTGSFRQHLYKTSKGETAWAGFELVDNEGWLRLSGTKGPVRIMPTPVPVLAPTPPVNGSEPQTWAVDVGKVVALLLFVQLWLSSTLVVTAFFAVRRYLVSRSDPHAEHSGQVFIDLEKAQGESYFKRLRGIKTFLHSTYLKWHQNAALATEIKGLREDLRQARVLISGLEDSERRLQSDLDDQKGKILRADEEISTLKDKLTTLKEQHRSLRQELDDARTKHAEDANTLRQEIQTRGVRIEDLQRDLEQSKKSQLSLSSDLAQSRQETSTLKDQRTTLTKKRDSLKQELDDARRTHTEAERTLRQEIATWKVDEANSRRELGVSQQAAQRLGEARTEIGELRGTLQNLGQAAQRLEALGAVNAVSPFLRRAQNQFLDETNVQSAGLLAFLVTHSLNQLALSRAFSQETKESAMLWNLHNIASKLAHYPGFVQALPRLKDLGASDAPLADDLIAVNAQHEDSKLFQLILKQIKTSHRIDLAPFYYDVAKDGRVVRAN
jgi:hypothetical protein